MYNHHFNVAAGTDGTTLITLYPAGWFVNFPLGLNLNVIHHNLLVDHILFYYSLKASKVQIPQKCRLLKYNTRVNALWVFLLKILNTPLKLFFLFT